MAAAAEGAVDIDAVGGCDEGIHRLMKQDGGV
jgi:hypothetical protein